MTEIAAPARPCFACKHQHDPTSPGTCWEADCLPKCPEHCGPELEESAPVSEG